jgi:FKBP-type peptidyl-prolyl cis-trans isomerase FkpA
MAATAVLLVLRGAHASTEADPVEPETVYSAAYKEAAPLIRFHLNAAQREIVMQGIRDGMAGKQPPFNVESYKGKKTDDLLLRLSEKVNRDFVERQAKQKGMQRLPSGILYADLRPGTGPSPTSRDWVSLKFWGQLSDGTEFENTYKRGKAFIFSLER